MTQVVVADAGPLIGLGHVGRLVLLRDLYRTVLIPPRVREELRIGSGCRVGGAGGGLDPSGAAAASRYAGLVDAGEAEAIAFAREVPLRFLLIDDRRGRDLARRLGVTVVGTGGVLLTAKKRGLVDALRPVLAELSAAGYRLSGPLQDRLLALAGEGKAR